MKADWSSSAAACPWNRVRGEHLVPVVADPAAGPAIPAAAGQTHRVGVGRSEERFCRRGAPVEQEPTARAVGETESSDVHRLRVVCADQVPEAQVQAEATQGAQASGQPVDLQVPVHCRLAPAAGCLALGIEAVGQVGDRLLEALRDGREVLLVAGDQCRVGLVGEVVGEVKRAGGQGVHVISSDPPATLRSPAARTPAPPSPARATAQRVPSVRRLRATHMSTTTHAFCDPHFRRFWPTPAILRHNPGLAASPPVRYTLKVEGSGYSPSTLPSAVDLSPLSSAVDGRAPCQAVARRIPRCRGPQDLP